MSNDTYEALSAVLKEIRGAEARKGLRYLQKRIHDLEVLIARTGTKPPATVKPKEEDPHPGEQTFWGRRTFD